MLAHTLFDPCPAGWRVPRSGEGERSPWSHFITDRDAYDFGTPNATETSHDTLPDSGYHFYLYGTSGSTVWYGSGGFRLRTDEGIGSVGTHGYYWTTTYDPDKEQYFCFGHHTQKAFPFYRVAGVFGFSVRCIRE